MTTTELDTELLDLLGENSTGSSQAYSIAGATRYRILSRAYRRVIKKTWVTWRPGANWTIAVDDETFALKTLLGLASTQDILDVVRCQYHAPGFNSWDLHKVDYGTIEACRNVNASPGNYPSAYCFRRFNSIGTDEATLEIYPPAKDAGSGILTIDYLLNPNTNLSASVDPVTPTYADDTIVAFAGAYALRVKRNPEWKDQLKIANGMLEETLAKSYREAEGYNYNFGIRM